MATKYAPVPNVGSQVERALIAHLKNCYGDDAGLYQFLFSNCGLDRKPPFVETLAHKSVETVVGTRNETFQVQIEWKWPGADQPSQPDPDWLWIDINNFVGVGMAGLSLTDSDAGDVSKITALDITAAGNALAVDASNGADPAQVEFAKKNADMATFTCEAIFYKGATRAEKGDGSLFLREIRHFEVVACAANVS